MAVLSSFGVTVLLSGSVANPANSATFQVVAPWGKSSACTNIMDAITQVFEGKGGNMHTGRMGAYFSAQTLNGASGTGPTGFTTANEVGN